MTQAPEPPPPETPDSREMFTEINALMAALSRAFALEPEALAAALERGAVALDLRRNAAGKPTVVATYGDRTVHISQESLREAVQPKAPQP